MSRCRILLLSIIFFSVASYAQIYDRLTNIPTIYIETHDGGSVTSKEEYKYADMVYIAGNDTVRYDSLRIRIRGNSTAGLAKKPYRIKFKESTKFLGKGFAKNKSWTLLANHGDKTLLRNAVTSRMGEFLGLPFNPAAHFVDLFLNKTYLGNYQVSDQVNVDNKRVEIFEQEEYPTGDSNITGGYLLEIDGFGTAEPYYFRTNKGVIISIKSPDEDCIANSQVDYIREHINIYEDLLFSDDFTNPESGYRTLVDSATLVNWYIATELSGNYDGFWSTYIYKDKDDPKIYFGPLWDYDIAYNNDYRTGDVTNYSMVEKGFGQDLTGVWVKRFIQDPWFNKAVNDAWKEKVSAGLENHLLNYIDSMAVVLDLSQEYNFSRYEIDRRAYHEIYLYSTYSEYIEQLKGFISDHASFLTTLFSERAGDDDGEEGGGEEGGDEVEPELLPFELKESFYYRVYNKGTNMVFDIKENSEGVKEVVMMSPVYGDNAQLWKIEKVGDYYRLINREYEMAFNDPSMGRGTHLNLADINDDDNCQLWNFVVVNENGNYNVINLNSDLAINNNGGFSNEGNNVISYNNDDRNSVSNNRQWRIVPEEPIPESASDEVKSMLANSISDAETFLATLNDWNVGDGILCYSSKKVEELRQLLADAKDVNSDLQDDYILMNINLKDKLNEVSRVNLPESGMYYSIKHKSSGLSLNIASDEVVIMPYDENSGRQHFTIQAVENNGKYKIKSGFDLYLSQGTDNEWNMYGLPALADENLGSFSIELNNGCYYIHTENGLLGTSKNVNGSIVFADNDGNVEEELKNAEWTIEAVEANVDFLMQQKLAELEVVLDVANERLASIPSYWIGEAPFQLSVQNVEYLEKLIEDNTNKEFMTVSECNDAIEELNYAIEDLTVINSPDRGNYYNIVNLKGYAMSVSDGIIADNNITNSVYQCFSFIPVDGVKNCYNIRCNGMYLYVIDGDEAIFGLADTPHGDSGRFVLNVVGKETITITSCAGLVGVANNVANGDPILPNATGNGVNVKWIVDETEVDEGSTDTGIESVGYERNIDYAVRYDKLRQVIGFVSYDLQELENVDVQIYTTGGSLLYTFKAVEEQSLANIPTGTYFIRWSWAGRDYNIKFVKE